MNSVCIATYNGEQYIAEQLISILSQISEDDEVIISDDNSTDKTIEIIKNFHDPRIIIIRNTTSRHGAIGNFENALRHVSGRYIFLSDQDDIWFENKYQVMLSYLKKYDLVHCNSKVVDDSLNILNNSFYDVLHNGTGIIKNIKKSTYFGSHMAFNSRLIKYILPFPNTEEIGHDLWIGLVSELKGSVIFINDTLMYYRRHANAFCSIFEGSKRSLCKKLYGRILMLVELLKFKIRFHGVKNEL